MNQSPRAIDKLSPDDLMSGFSRSSLLLGLVLSAAVHIVLVAGTSWPYIRDTYVDPEGARQRAAQLQAQRLEAQAKADKAAHPAPASQPAPATAPVPAPPAAVAPESNPNYDNSPMKQRLEAVAPPEELPLQPSLDLGLEPARTPAK